MPYINEFAGNTANQKAMTQGEHIDRIKSLRLRPKAHNYQRLDSTLIHQFDNQVSIENAIVIDGSKYESEVDSLYSSKLVLLNFNQSFIRLSNLSNYLKKDFPLPQEFQSIAQDYHIQVILPTEGFANDNYTDENDFFRYSLFKTLQSIENPFLPPQSSYKETLLGTLTHLFSLTLKGQVKAQPCPECSRMGHNMSLKDFTNDDGKIIWQTHCKCKDTPREVYITDFLSLHIQLNSETSNEALTTQIMLILEKIIFINLLRNLYLNQQYEFIAKTAFVLDGSLAVYSHASWLSEAIHKEIAALQEKQKIIIIGVEKTGSFVDHTRKVEEHFSQHPISPKAIFAFDDNYIKKYIKTYDNDNYYGEKTHFGKKIYYKNKLGASFIINIAYSSEEDKTLSYNLRNTKEYIEQIYQIKDIIWLFDNFSSSSYDNAFSLLSFAHKGAALSNGVIGKHLLDRFLKTVF